MLLYGLSDDENSLKKAFYYFKLCKLIIFDSIFFNINYLIYYINYLI